MNLQKLLQVMDRAAANLAKLQGIWDRAEPMIPSGAVCLFGRPAPPPIDGRILLVAHDSLVDDELGGPYALKRVRHARRGESVVLESVNRDFAPIDLGPRSAELRVIAEFVRVLVP